ncbi:MAG: hypothetical protein HYR85_02845 [Planctomycetes bacterium]|nr:hypothetical protein [Planctomycetota bacterium]MBI3843126.1 hypothetical protein [Planctomycetota bacterium]
MRIAPVLVVAAIAGCASPPRPLPPEVTLIDSAEAALGTPETLARFRGFHSTMKGSWLRPDGSTPYSAEAWYRPPLALRWLKTTASVTEDGAVDGDSGWYRTNGAATATLDPARLREAQAMAVEYAILLVRPLRSKEFTLAYSGPSEVAGRPTETLRVSWRGAVTRTVHFDHETHLVVKTEGPQSLQGQNGDFALVVDRWADEGGLRFPVQTHGEWNGARRYDCECTAVEWAEPPPETLFLAPPPAKP